MMQAVEGSLRRLQTDHIDLIMPIVGMTLRR